MKEFSVSGARYVPCYKTSNTDSVCLWKTYHRGLKGKIKALHFLHYLLYYEIETFTDLHALVSEFER